MTTGSTLPWEPSLGLLVDLKTTERWATLITVSKEIYSSIKQGTVRGKSLAQIAVAMGQMLEL